jgi:hypothetical protein
MQVDDIVCYSFFLRKQETIQLPHRVDRKPGPVKFKIDSEFCLPVTFKKEQQAEANEYSFHNS